MWLTFKMNKGHILKTPANLTSTVNLNNPVNVVVLMMTARRRKPTR